MSYTLEELVQELEWRKIAPDWNHSTVDEKLAAFMHFCEKHWYIRHPERGRIKFELYETQVAIVELWLRERYSICLKARQVGFSTLVAAFCFWLTFFYSDRAIVMLSKTERDAVKLLAKAKYGARFLPDWIKFRGPVVNVNMTKMEMSNESYLESLPSASDPARGETVYTVVVDEMGQLPNSDEAWAAIEPIADVGGRVIMLGTAAGEGNLFHTLWTGSRQWRDSMACVQNGTNRFYGYFSPWWANGRDEDWYDAKKADLPDWQLAQEYPSNPDEAFLRSGNPVFNVDALKAMVASPPLRGYLARDSNGQIVFTEDGGPLRVWEEPVKGARYVIGADVAEGLEHGDFSAAYVIDAKSRRVVACYHARVDSDLFGSDVLFNLGNWYNRALVGVENNNMGLVTNKALYRLGYSPLYRQRPQTKGDRQQPTEILGWRTSAITKPLIIGGLNQAIRDQQLTLLDGECHTELRTYVREGDGKMHGSPFDDRVMALALAVKMLEYVWLKEYQPVVTPPPGTFGYFERMMFGELDRKAKFAKERAPIGQHSVRSQ